MNLLDETEKLAIAAAAVKQRVDQVTAKGTMESSAAIESAKQAASSLAVAASRYRCVVWHAKINIHRLEC